MGKSEFQVRGTKNLESCNQHTQDCTIKGRLHHSAEHNLVVASHTCLRSTTRQQAPTYLIESQMKSPPRSPAASPRGRPFDRHSATGTRGLPKKGGAGSKGVWGAAMDQEGVAVLDKNDPNYDSDTELPVAPPKNITLAEPKVIESAGTSADDKKQE